MINIVFRAWDRFGLVRIIPFLSLIGNNFQKREQLIPSFRIVWANSKWTPVMTTMFFRASPNMVLITRFPIDFFAQCRYSGRGIENRIIYADSCIHQRQTSGCDTAQHFEEAFYQPLNSPEQKDSSSSSPDIAALIAQIQQYPELGKILSDVLAKQASTDENTENGNGNLSDSEQQASKIVRFFLLLLQFQTANCNLLESKKVPHAFRHMTLSGAPTAARTRGLSLRSAKKRSPLIPLCTLGVPYFTGFLTFLSVRIFLQNTPVFPG